MLSVQRLVRQGGGILLFLLLIACLSAYIVYKYLNKNTLPEESLRRAIAKGEIVPFYQPGAKALYQHRRRGRGNPRPA